MTERLFFVSGVGAFLVSPDMLSGLRLVGGHAVRNDFYRSLFTDNMLLILVTNRVVTKISRRDYRSVEIEGIIEGCIL